MQHIQALCLWSCMQIARKTHSAYSAMANQPIHWVQHLQQLLSHLVLTWHVSSTCTTTFGSSYQTITRMCCVPDRLKSNCRHLSQFLVHLLKQWLQAGKVDQQAEVAEEADHLNERWRQRQLRLLLKCRNLMSVPVLWNVVAEGLVGNKHQTCICISLWWSVSLACLVFDGGPPVYLCI